MGKFFEELKRRNVIKATIAYLVVAWVILQVLSILLPNIGAPSWVMKTIILLLVLFLPVWILISWLYEVSPDGLKKTESIPLSESISDKTNQRLNILIFIGIILAIAVSFVNRNPDKPAQTDSTTLLLEKSIAVLPFNDLSSEGDSEWFCDGVTEDILTNLSKIKSLKVISKTSSEKYKNSGKSVPEIAKELGVSYLVEGSVRKFNDKIVITAQLIDANDRHLWAENYNDDFKEVFKIQQDVSNKIVEQLKIAISPEEQKIINTAPTKNLEAYQNVLKGRRLLFNSMSTEDIKKSIALFEEATLLDSKYAEAYAELAYAYLMLYFNKNNNSPEDLKKSKENIDKALLINTNTSLAYTTLAVIHDETKSGWDKSSKDYEKALSINPNLPTANFEYGLHFWFNPLHRDLKKYLHYINKAQELDPTSAIINFEKVRALSRNDKFEEAEKHLNKINNLLREQDKINLKLEILSYRHKDWSKGLEFALKEFEKQPKNAFIAQIIAELYDGVLNDDKNAVKYFEKAYNLDSLDIIIIRGYHTALVENGDFKKAEQLFNSSNFQDNVSEYLKKRALFYKLYHEGRLIEAEKILNDSLMADRITDKILIKAKLGKIDELNSMFEKELININSKCFMYAILQNRDSLYSSLLNTEVNARLINSRSEFDPYRSEERYKEFLRKYYFPIDNQVK